MEQDRSGSALEGVPVTLGRVEKLMIRATAADAGAVVNNVWLYGDEDEVIVIDAAHDAHLIANAVGARRVRAIVCTHAHSNHINVAWELALELEAPVLLHPDDRGLWDRVHDRAPDGDLTEGQVLTVAGSDLRVLHTPGHSPGGICLVGEGLVFSGDTLLHGGPGAAARSDGDFPALLDSLRTKLLTLSPDTLVHPGHGEDTTIGAATGAYDAWPVRGQ